MSSGVLAEAGTLVRGDRTAAALPANHDERAEQAVTTDSLLESSSEKASSASKHDLSYLGEDDPLILGATCSLSCMAYKNSCCLDI